VGQLTKIGLAIAWAVVFALPAGVVADDRIEFGPPGPPQTIAFDDAVAAASVTFRVSHDAHFNGGPAGVSPSISSGSLTVRSFGMSRRYDLSTILPIATNRINLSKESGCGTATALSRRSSYIVVEAILAEKGCAPLAAFIDLHDGRVAKEAIFDPAWAHRFDVHPYHASGSPIRIMRVERVVPEASRWNPDGASSSMVAWPFLVVHATDARGATLIFAVDPGNQPAVDERAVALNAGDAALLGTSAVGDPYVLVQFFSGERFVRPGRAAEARFDALQTPTPEDFQARIRRNHWFEEASELARRGDIVGAVDAFATMVSFHGGGGDIDANDAAMLATCRDLVRRVRAGAVSAGIASGTFSNGCVLQPTRTVRPIPKGSS
jgi:hypothetical protein